MLSTLLLNFILASNFSQEQSKSSRAQVTCLRCHSEWQSSARLPASDGTTLTIALYGPLGTPSLSGAIQCVNGHFTEVAFYF